MPKKLLIVTLVLMTFNITYAGQIKKVEHMQTLSVDLSIKDPNIISVANDRIAQYSVVKGAVSANIDEDSQFLSLKPSAMYYEKPFSMIIFTEKGYRYTLLSNPKSIPAQDIVLDNNQTIVDQEKFNNDYQSEIASLVKAMINNTKLDGFNIDNVDINVVDAQAKLATVYRGKNFNGEVLLFNNDTDEDIALEPQIFFNLNTLAISFTTVKIKPEQATKVYRVVKNERV